MVKMNFLLTVIKIQSRGNSKQFHWGSFTEFTVLIEIFIIWVTFFNQLHYTILLPKCSIRNKRISLYHVSIEKKKTIFLGLPYLIINKSKTAFLCLLCFKQRLTFSCHKKHIYLLNDEVWWALHSSALHWRFLLGVNHSSVGHGLQLIVL